MVTNLLSTERGGISEIFCSIKCLENWPIDFCLQQHIINFFRTFIIQALVKDINSLSSIIKFSQKAKSVSDILFWIYYTVFSFVNFFYIFWEFGRIRMITTLLTLSRSMGMPKVMVILFTLARSKLIIILLLWAAYF